MPLAALSPEVKWLLAAWLFLLGGAVGSFLNVVIYRLPAGMSLIRPGSHCPACKKPIRWFDNVPVLGWLILRGRCRDCRAKISARYPIIEAVTAGLFLLLGAVECLWDGANPPVRAEGFSQLCGIYPYHLLLLCTLLAAVVIEADGHRVPLRLVAPALVLGWSVPLFWPSLHPVPAYWPLLNSWIVGLVDGTSGLAVGLLLGWLASRSCTADGKPGMILGAASVGLFLGWQAVVVLMTVTLAIHLPLMVAGRLLPAARRIPPTAWLALAALGWILSWSWWLGQWRSPS
ncbi:MAG: prepilin peptidase [Planctomycetota bacterium]|jgi:leader peptidase (prepilin peptidase)/N-methyltransferase